MYTRYIYIHKRGADAIHHHAEGTELYNGDYMVQQSRYEAKRVVVERASRVIYSFVSLYTYNNRATDALCFLLLYRRRRRRKPLSRQRNTYIHITEHIIQSRKKGCICFIYYIRRPGCRHDDDAYGPFWVARPS